MEESGKIEPTGLPRGEIIHVLTEAAFNAKYPKADILSKSGDCSTVWHVTGLESKVRKENQPHVGREALTTEAIAVSRIWNTPVDIALVGNTDIAIAVPKADGKRVVELLRGAPDQRENISKSIVQDMAHHIYTAHHFGVIVGDVKIDDLIIDSGRHKTAWVDYSSGYIVPQIAEEAVRQLDYDAGSFESFSNYLDNIGGEEVLRDFLRDAEALAQHAENFNSGKISLNINEAIPEYIGLHNHGIALLQRRACEEYYGEDQVTQLMKDVGQVSGRKFFESQEDKQSLLQKEKEQVQIIYTFLNRMINRARGLETQLGIQYYISRSSFSAKADEYIHTKVADILGYKDASLNSLKGLPVAPRVPPLFISQVEKYSPAMTAVDIFFRNIRTMYAREALQDWVQLLAETKKPSLAQTEPEAIPQIEKAISQMEKLIEEGDFYKLHALELQLDIDLSR
jgi:hypothetical protein